MDNLTLFKCKNCHGELNIRQAVNGVLECEYCHTPWTVPKEETTSETIKYLHDGTAALDVCKFEDAFTYFQKAAELDKNEPEAYFGMALAQFKVQYLKDEVNNCLQPICHEISEKVFTEDKNYKKALDLATSEQKKVYRKKGGEIDDIREEFFDLKKQGTTFDCFICVKVTAENGNSHTEDYVRAEEIFDFLKEKGLNPFFSERVARRRVGSAYEALILYALYTSECMLIVCSDENYLQTKWVKNEYTRFINLMQEGGKERDALTFVFAGKPIEKLPSGKKIQGIDYDRKDALDKIYQYVVSHTPEAKKKREAEKHGLQTTVATIMTRGYQELGDGHVDAAQKFFDRILAAEPESAEGWWGKFLCEMGFWNDSQVNDNLSPAQLCQIKKSVNYKHAIEFASGEFKEHLDGLCAKISNAAKIRRQGLDKQQKKLILQRKKLQERNNYLKKIRAANEKYNMSDQGSGKSFRTKKSSKKILIILISASLILFLVLLISLFVGFFKNNLDQYPKIFTWVIQLCNDGVCLTWAEHSNDLVECIAYILTFLVVDLLQSLADVLPLIFASVMIELVSEIMKITMRQRLRIANKKIDTNTNKYEQINREISQTDKEISYIEKQITNVEEELVACNYLIR